MSLPIVGYHSYEHYVKDLSRAEHYYTKVLGFKVIGRSTHQAETLQGMKRLVLAGGKTIHLVLSVPTHPWSIAAQYLAIHPEGVPFLNFRVRNFDRLIDNLTEKRATFLYNRDVVQDAQGIIKQTAIATPLTDVSYRFIDDSQYKGFGPQFEMFAPAGQYESPHGFECIDHVTSNVRTLQPLMAFYKDVMGFADYWNVEFHTNDINPSLPVGSGLKSQVVWHPDSGIKFANNEPAPPFFRNSQIDIYLRDNHGSGIQHVAFRVKKILPVMDQLYQAGGLFLKAPEEYYEKVDSRLAKAGFKGKIKENRTDIAKQSILIDGGTKGYLLQIFSHEMTKQFKDTNAGPLFYEIIQREGNDGFGEGNFRALFETIEFDQIAMAKTAKTLPLETL